MVSMVLSNKVDWSTFPTTTQVRLLLENNQKNILDLYDPEAQPSAPTEQKLLLKNTTMPTMKVSRVTSDAIQLDSTQTPTKVSNASFGSAKEEVFLTPLMNLISTPNVITR